MFVDTEFAIKVNTNRLYVGSRDLLEKCFCVAGAVKSFSEIYASSDHIFNRNLGEFNVSDDKIQPLKSFVSASEEKIQPFICLPKSVS